MAEREVEVVSELVFAAPSCLARAAPPRFCSICSSACVNAASSKEGTWAAGDMRERDGPKPAFLSPPQNSQTSRIGDDRGRIALGWSELALTAVLEVVAATDLQCVTRAKSRAPLLMHNALLDHR